jgi:hypothetical protein
MGQESEIEATQLAFNQAIRREQTRLRTGFAMRDYISTQLKAGVLPTHYRVQWIENSVDRIIDLLQILATEFNDAHPNDKASAHDLVDILQSTSKTIVRRVGG